MSQSITILYLNVQYVAQDFTLSKNLFCQYDLNRV